MIGGGNVNRAALLAGAAFLGLGGAIGYGLRAYAPPPGPVRIEAPSSPEPAELPLGMTPTATERVVEPSYLEPEVDATERSPEELARASNDGPFPYTSGMGYTAFYEDRPGHCSIVLGYSADELARAIEGFEADRLVGYTGFADGIVVHLRQRKNIQVWVKKIDCADPPYDPTSSDIAHG